eukprot:12270430-Heterocapsa_arctica.AAC.1
MSGSLGADHRFGALAARGVPQLVCALSLVWALITSSLGSPAAAAPSGGAAAAPRSSRSRACSYDNIT